MTDFLSILPPPVLFYFYFFKLSCFVEWADLFLIEPWASGCALDGFAADK